MGVRRRAEPRVGMPSMAMVSVAMPIIVLGGSLMDLCPPGRLQAPRRKNLPPYQKNPPALYCETFHSDKYYLPVGEMPVWKGRQPQPR